jgi:hypothetical protein
MRYALKSWSSFIKITWLGQALTTKKFKGEELQENDLKNNLNFNFFLFIQHVWLWSELTLVCYLLSNASFLILFVSTQIFDNQFLYWEPGKYSNNLTGYSCKMVSACKRLSLDPYVECGFSFPSDEQSSVVVSWWHAVDGLKARYHVRIPPKS